MAYPNHTIKTTLKTNFSFKKLADNIEKVFEGVSDDFGLVAENSLKENIDDAKYVPLTKFTMRKRRQGLGWNGKKVSPTNSKIPLRQTDTLYDSLTYNKKTKSINMMAYGFKHNRGFENPNGDKVPARPFIEPSLKNVKKDLKVELTNKIKRAIKK